MRAGRAPGLRIDAHPVLPAPAPLAVSFEFEGRRLEGRPGEAISSALIASGYSVLGRSMKYHRPRGLTCFASACPNCAMNVDGIPGVLACGTPLRGGEVVGRERAWPRAEFDALGLLDRLSWLLPAGFQFRWFAHRPRLSHAAHAVMGRVAGGGRLPTSAAAAAARRGLRGHHPVDVAVVGGGAAGLAAALAAAEGGAGVVLVEKCGRLGGSLLQETRMLEHAGVPAVRACVLAEQLAAQALAHPRILTLPSAVALGWYEGNVLPVDTGDGVLAVAARRIVVATGTYEEPIPFENCDRPGIMFASAAQRLINVDRVRPGHRAIVVTREAYGYVVAAQLRGVGVEVAAVIDSRDHSTAHADRERFGVEAAVHAHSHPLRAHGGRRVRALTVRSAANPARTRRLSCDTVVLAGGRRPADEIGLQVSYAGSILLEPVGGLGDLDGSGERGTLEGVWLAGGAAGAQTLEEAVLDGAARGRVAGAEL